MGILSYFFNTGHSDRPLTQDASISRVLAEIQAGEVRAIPALMFELVQIVQLANTEGNFNILEEVIQALEGSAGRYFFLYRDTLLGLLTVLAFKSPAGEYTPQLKFLWDRFGRDAEGEYLIDNLWLHSIYFKESGITEEMLTQLKLLLSEQSVEA